MERGKPHPLAYDELPNDVLTQRFIAGLPEQEVPENFWISQLPREVLYFVTRALQIAASSLGVAKKPETKMPTAFSADGWDSVGPAEADPLITLLSHHEGELFTKAFLQCYQTASWGTSGNITGTRSSPVASGTVRQAAGHLATAFRGHLRDSPVHVKGSPNMPPFVRSLRNKAFENEDPPKNQQQAITPKLLRGNVRRIVPT